MQGITITAHKPQFVDVHMDFSQKKCYEFLLTSDHHWDNPKCDRELLKNHMDEAVRRGAGIIFNGDTFCLMQGKGDPRGSKDDIRPEHNNGRYLDSIVETALEWYSPYASSIISIGYGNHECYRPDTQVLTDNGWIPITEVTVRDNVAVFDKEKIWYEKPNYTFSKKVDRLITIEGFGTKQVVSPKNGVVMSDMTKVNAEELLGKHLRYTDLANGMKYQGEEFEDLNLIRLLTWVVMDATLVDYRKYDKGSGKRRVQFKLSKERKINALRELLDEMGVPYTFAECKKSGINKLQPYYIRIYGDAARWIFDELDDKKQLPKWFAHLTGEAFKALIETIEITDGFKSSESSQQWSTVSKWDVDIVQQACALNGYICQYTIKPHRSGFENAQAQYAVTICSQYTKAPRLSVTEEKYDGLVYCLNMPQGNFITRIDGKVAFSGNSSVIKYRETDVLQRFVDLMNYKNGTQINCGGYGGYVIFKGSLNEGNTGQRPRSIRMYMFHGSGGGGVVTKGVIGNNRRASSVDADIYWTGHIHESWVHHDVMISPDVVNKKIIERPIAHVCTSTYKREWNAKGGWHTERGAPMKPIGSAWLRIYADRQSGGTRAPYMNYEIIPCLNQY